LAVFIHFWSLKKTTSQRALSVPISDIDFLLVQSRELGLCQFVEPRPMHCKRLKLLIGFTNALDRVVGTIKVVDVRRHDSGTHD